MSPMLAVALLAIAVIVILAIFGHLPKVHPADSGIVSAIVWVGGIILIVFLVKHFLL